ncbi:MAG: acetyltransferase [Planctomycetota bacterium]|nr:MAG: acetyltransferase [Planctomycetota bacterium]
MIRPYAETDKAELLAVWDRASALAHPFLSAEFQAQVRHDIGEVYLPITRTWVFERHDRVVGFISMIEREIGGLFVEPELHGQGLGRALTDHARAELGALEVEVFERNTIGRAFYDRYGFQLIERKDHPETGEKVLRLGLASEGSSG